MACTGHSDEEDSATSSSHWEAQADLCCALRGAEKPQLLSVRDWLQQPAAPKHRAAAASCWEQASPRARCDLGAWANDPAEAVHTVPRSRAQPKRRPSLLAIPRNNHAAASSPGSEEQLVPNMSTMQFQKRRKCHAYPDSKVQEMSGDSGVLFGSEPLLVPTAQLSSLCGLQANTRITLTPQPVPAALSGPIRRAPLVRPPALVLPQAPAAPGADTPHSSVRRVLAVDVPFGGDTPLPGGALSTPAMRASLEHWMAAMEDDAARRRGGRALPPPALGFGVHADGASLPMPAFVLLGMASRGSC